MNQSRTGPTWSCAVHTGAGRRARVGGSCLSARLAVARAVEYLFKELGELPTCECAEHLELRAETSAEVGIDRADLGGGVPCEDHGYAARV